MKIDIELARKNVLKIIVPLIAILALGAAGYFYNEVRALKQSPQAVALKEATDLVAQVSKVAVLPQGETPTIATVSDKEALKDQPFFVNAEKGDKVLIYAQAKKAVLYSVSMNKVIDIAPLNIGTPTKSTTPTTPTPTPAKTTTTTPTAPAKN